MRIPEHLHSSLIEQLEDQASSDDFLIMRGTALGYGLLGNDSKRDEFIQKFLDTEEPDFEGNEMARELQARSAGLILLNRKSKELLRRSKEIFETQLEKALPNLPDNIEIDVPTEPLRMARQSRSGLMENAFLSKDWDACVREARHSRSLIPDYLLYQPHREGYPIEFVSKGMAKRDSELVSRGVQMQEEFMQYVTEVGYLKPWENPYFVSYAILTKCTELLDL